MNRYWYRLCLLFLLVLTTASAASGADHPAFDRWFLDETLRIDYFHTGNSGEEIISLDQMWRQGSWAGSRKHLADTLDLGRYYAKVYDSASGELLWSRGFDSYYGEWKTTSQAAQGVRRTYHESALVPFPKAPIEFTLEVRDADYSLAEIYRVKIDPASFLIRRDPLIDGVIVVKSAYSGDSHSRVDVAILGEGYTAAEEDKFRADLDRLPVRAGRSRCRRSARAEGHDRRRRGARSRGLRWGRGAARARARGGLERLPHPRRRRAHRARGLDLHGARVDISRGHQHRSIHDSRLAQPITHSI